VRFARQELFLGGLIDGTSHGLWRLTDDGRRTNLSTESARRIASLRHHPRAGTPSVVEPSADISPDRTADTEPSYARAPSAERPTLGPVPSAWTASVTHSVTGPGWTYSMRFGNRDLWKVGHTSDLAARLVEVNRHVPHEILGERWTVFLSHAWATRVWRMQWSNGFSRPRGVQNNR
jgi:hypothetical protein